MTATRLAIFIGGKSTRMGTPKGLLPLPGGGPPILRHLTELGVEVELDPFLVGDAAPYSAVAPEMSRVEDDPPGVGPLGGLRAALSFARAAGARRLVCIACDMPYLNASALRTLTEHQAEAPVVAARRSAGAPWEPLLARYEIANVLPVLDAALASGERSFQALFSRLEVAPVAVDASFERALRDWDTPDDVVP